MLINIWKRKNTELKYPGKIETFIMKHWPGKKIDGQLKLSFEVPLAPKSRKRIELELIRYADFGAGTYGPFVIRIPEIYSETRLGALILEIRRTELGLEQIDLANLHAQHMLGFGGRKLLALAEGIAKYIGFADIRLRDVSSVPCSVGGRMISLKLISFWRYGATWYERQGYHLVYNGDVTVSVPEYEAIKRRVREMKVGKIIDELRQVMRSVMKLLDKVETVDKIVFIHPLSQQIFKFPPDKTLQILSKKWIGEIAQSLNILDSLIIMHKLRRKDNIAAGMLKILSLDCGTYAQLEKLLFGSYLSVENYRIPAISGRGALFNAPFLEAVFYLGVVQWNEFIKELN